MKRTLFLLFAAGLAANMGAMTERNAGNVRGETHFLTDKMAYELRLSAQQYNDAYEINYDFICSVRSIMNDVVRGCEWALDEYYEALDIRNDELRWVLSDVQYRRFLGAAYFSRPIHVTGGSWSFRVYVNYPNRSLFYLGIPVPYYTYGGAHYRPYFHHASFYRDRYTHLAHYAAPHRVREQAAFHAYRRSDFGSVSFRPNTSVRPANVPSRLRPETASRRDDSHSSSAGSSSAVRNHASSSGSSNLNRGNSGQSSAGQNSSNRGSSGQSSSNRGSASQNSPNRSSSGQNTVSGRQTVRSSSSSSAAVGSAKSTGAHKSSRSSSRSAERGNASSRK